ncbi:NmrA family protein [Penicillium brasilianum]|uniref:NmrA family protein n=1 Tax=Penicillium brasilianum TaxID=104259 RepID=A0A1S9RKS7_PENBI|nr:NmrA family protein [Penicillium brasilianum]
MEQAAGCGARIFVSFAGPTYGSKGTPVTEAMKLIFPMLVANHYKRAMVLGTCSYPSPQDKGGLKWKLSVALIKIIGGSAYEEFRGLGEFVASQDPTQLPWTLFRVPFLTNGAEAPVKASYTGHGDDGFFLSRRSMASWVLKEMDKDSVQVGKTPVISN